jgi:glycosyltransferase involved in cell wall biosynthesis
MFSAYLLKVPSRLYQIWGLRFESTSGIQRCFLKLMEIVTAYCSTDVIANSRSLADEVLQHRITKNIKVVGAGSSHGINVSKFDPEGPYEVQSIELRNLIESRKKESIVLYLGRVTRDKGVDTLLRAFEIAQKNEREFALVIAGEIEDKQLAERIKQMAGDNLVFFSHVEDVRPLLSISGLLCLPTLREGFPNVVLEAAAMCVPSIVSNATGSKDSVEDGITGIIFPVGNAEYLEEKIHTLVNSTNLSSMGKAARERVIRLYSQDHFFSQMGSYLHGLVNRTNF